MKSGVGERTASCYCGRVQRRSASGAISDKVEWCPVADDLPKFGGESGTEAL